MADISGMKDLIPEKYFKTHEYEDDKETKIVKVKKYMEDGSIPLDLAVCRYLAIEKNVIAMPNSLFYHDNSKFVTDKYIRLAISRGVEDTMKCIEKLKGGKWLTI